MRSEYKEPPDRNMRAAIHRRCKACIYVYLGNLAFFSLVIWALNERAHYIVSFGIVSSILYVSAVILTIIGCTVYDKTFKHRLMTIPTILAAAISLCLYSYPFIFVCNYLNWNEYMYCLIPMIIEPLAK